MTPSHFARVPEPLKHSGVCSKGEPRFCWLASAGSIRFSFVDRARVSVRVRENGHSVSGGFSSQIQNGSQIRF